MTGSHDYDEEPQNVFPDTLEGARAELAHLDTRIELHDFEPSDTDNAWILPLLDCGWVYFARAVGTPYIKIGFTGGEDPHARIAQLQTSSPHELVLVATFEGTQQEEAALHKRLSHLRVRGEWFTITEWEASAIARRGWLAEEIDVCEGCARPVNFVYDGHCWQCCRARDEAAAEAAAETLQ